ncbi:MAG: hypothetical protein ACJ72Z_03375 [Pyrinomonadaceae bacterium]
MKRFSEKVKDIVEVRSYEVVSDLLAEPALTVSSYQFSDATTDLTVKWLDEVSNGAPGGRCRAIAGYRGVGKSHFLAMVSVIASHPEVRSLITETHVGSASQRLLRRHYPVVNVRRGLRPSLIDELKAAAAEAFEVSEESLGFDVAGILEKVRQLSADLPAILLIDTASDRTSPVERNDGDDLATIASESAKLGIFVGLALDDDIADADGSNLAISRSFAIDYLDPEHLHKVVNSLIFPKHSRMQTVLSGVYAYFRDSVPQFRWSEQRFSALYPLHPATLELAPYIRAYLPDFALLGFASEAGEKILGRPADSLIGFEEIFDSTESDLRKVEETTSAFAAYDDLTGKLISTMPVTERHRAKLVLKTLFLLSLSGRSSTVDEIASAMLVVDDADLQQSRVQIESALKAFAKALPEAVTLDDSGVNVAYTFRIGSNKLARELHTLASEISEADVDKLYLRAIGMRFPEIAGSSGDSESDFQPVEMAAIWRGTLRQGRMQVFALQCEVNYSFGETIRPHWELQVRLDDRRADAASDESGSVKIEWLPDPLTNDEKRRLASHHVLKTNSELRAKYGDQLSALIQSHNRTVESIVDRTMIADARLAIDGFDYNFSEAAREAQNLSGMLTVMLEPLFESIYYEHPYFKELLSDEAVENFIKEVLGSQSRVGINASSLASSFGAPLSLVKSENDGFVPKSKDELSDVDSVRKILNLVDSSEGAPIGFHSVESLLGASPVGLSHQAVRLILASMAVNGLVEFVTTGNERISGRSLDLKIDWSEIAYLSRPSRAKVSGERLARWARAITGDDSILSLDDPDDRRKVLEVLVDISSQWQRKNPIAVQSDIPELEFNTRVWRDRIRIADAYPEMIAMVDEALMGEIELDVCIERISEAFYDRPKTFFSVRDSVSAMENFGSSFQERERLKNYLTLVETSPDAAVEEARAAVWSTLRTSQIDPNEKSSRELGYVWTKFHRLYTEAYVSLHENVKANTIGQTWFESTVGQDRWRTFIASMESEPINKQFGLRFRRIRREIESLRCTDDPTLHLAVAPVCACALTFATSMSFDRLSTELNCLVSEVFSYFEDLVVRQREDIKVQISREIKGTSHEETNVIMSGLREIIDSDITMTEIPDRQLDVLGLYVTASGDDEFWPGAGIDAYDSSAAPLHAV